MGQRKGGRPSQRRQRPPDDITAGPSVSQAALDLAASMPVTTTQVIAELLKSERGLIEWNSACDRARIGVLGERVIELENTVADMQEQSTAADADKNAMDAVVKHAAPTPVGKEPAA